MSLYNMTCGNNPLFGLFVRMLDSVRPLPVVPRFRDLYLREEDGKPQIVIYTRTGGGNREDYETENEAMTLHPCFVCDFDDDFDSTYAHWVYRVPEKFSERALKLHRLICVYPRFSTPRDKFQRALDSIGKGPSASAPEVPAPTEEMAGEMAALLKSLMAGLEEPSSLERSLGHGQEEMP